MFHDYVASRMNLTGHKDAAMLEMAISWLRFMDFVVIISSWGVLLDIILPSSSSPSLWPADENAPNFFSDCQGLAKLRFIQRVLRSNMHPDCSSNRRDGGSWHPNFYNLLKFLHLAPSILCSKDGNVQTKTICTIPVLETLKPQDYTTI